MKIAPPLKVAGVVVSDEEAALVTAEGRCLKLALQADCCSQSFFDDGSAADLRALLGETITEVEERDCAGSTDELRLHALVITTTKGAVSIGWRNASNGYYDGWVSATLDGDVVPSINGR